MMNKLNSHILQLGICIGSIQAIKNNLVKNIRNKYMSTYTTLNGSFK